jgi:hypothetical protein
MLGVEVTRHKDGEPASQASGKVRLYQGSAGLDIDRQNLSWFTSQL